ncbi:MAG: tail fiber protein [Phycisphaerales bacterium]|nr:tail fiber protein [Phycisphaerales bacterium]
MANYFIGEIVSAGFNFNPRSFLPCDGRLINIRDNTALFSILGTQFGGDGRDTFGLPDLRATVPIGRGQTPEGRFYFIGDRDGAETHVLSTQELPAHTHRVRSSSDAPDKSPTNRVFAVPPTSVNEFAPEAAAPLGADSAAASMILPVGSNQAHDNMQPTLVVNYFICIAGVFPPRN